MYIPLISYLFCIMLAAAYASDDNFHTFRDARTHLNATSAVCYTIFLKFQELSLGRVSCLQIILNLLKEHQQGTFYCPPDLLCAATELLHALWYGRRETAMAVLREK
jgi:hypothetical protein